MYVLMRSNLYLLFPGEGRFPTRHSASASADLADGLNGAGAGGGGLQRYICISGCAIKFLFGLLYYVVFSLFFRRSGSGSLSAAAADAASSSSASSPSKNSESADRGRAR